MGLVLSDLIPMDQDWVWSGLVQPLKDPILSDLIGYQTRPDPIRSDSVGGPISISCNEKHNSKPHLSWRFCDLAINFQQNVAGDLGDAAAQLNVGSVLGWQQSWLLARLPAVPLQPDLNTPSLPRPLHGG